MKKLFFLFILITSPLLADYLVTVNSAYEVDYMFTILNAVSMIFSD